MKKLNILLIVSFIGFIFILVFNVIPKLPNSSEKCLEIKNYYLKIDCNGRVKGTFLNEKQHNNKTVIIKSSQEHESNVVLDFGAAKIFHYLNVNDSVYKLKGSETFLVHRDGKDTIFSLKHECPEK